MQQAESSILSAGIHPNTSSNSAEREMLGSCRCPRKVMVTRLSKEDESLMPGNGYMNSLNSVPYHRNCKGSPSPASLMGRPMLLTYSFVRSIPACDRSWRQNSEPPRDFL